MVKNLRSKIYGIIIFCFTIALIMFWVMYFSPFPPLVFFITPMGILLGVLPTILGLIVSIYFFTRKKIFKMTLEMVFCPYCNREAPINSVYCPVCGARLARPKPSEKNNRNKSREHDNYKLK